jgi:hypothetical protein
MALLMLSLKKEVNGMIQTQMDLETIWSILTGKHGVNHLGAMVVQPRLDYLLLIAGVVLIPI